MSIENINIQLAFFRDSKAEAINLSAIETAGYNIEEIKAKLPPEYLKFSDIFNRSKADKLPPYRPYNYKIELTDSSIPS